MSKILLVGSTGFLGREVKKELEKEHEVIATSVRGGNGVVELDVLDYNTTLNVIRTYKPEVVVNCAGIVANDESASRNVTITMNLLRAINEIDSTIRLIVSGSSAEYGVADKLPINESARINPISVYGKYKTEESMSAAGFGKKYGIDVLVLRIFNPIGGGMAEKFLIPSLMRQIKEIEAGDRSSILVSRLDTIRDYIDVRDVATAFSAVLSGRKHEYVYYNVGSGMQTTTQQIIDGLAKELGATNLVCDESSEEPELATQADIARTTSEFKWEPTHSLGSTLKEIVRNE